MKQVEGRHRTDSEEPKIYPLTPRQIQILCLIAEGLSYVEVANSLGISWHTVKNQCTFIRNKLHVTSMTQAVMIAVSLGIIRVDQCGRKYQFIDPILVFDCLDDCLSITGKFIETMRKKLHSYSRIVRRGEDRYDDKEEPNAQEVKTDPCR